MNFKKKAKEELNKMKQMSFKEKLRYLWDYYKPAMAGILILLLLVKVGIDIYQNSQIETMLSVAAFNCVSMGDQAEKLAEEFETIEGFDGEKEVVSFDTTYQAGGEGYSQMEMASQVKMTVMTQTGDMDVILLPKSAFDSLVTTGFFSDVRSVLSQENQEFYEGRFVYGKAEGDQEQIPYGIRIDDSEKIEGMFAEEEIYLAFGANIDNQETAENFLKYLLP